MTAPLPAVPRPVARLAHRPPPAGEELGRDGAGAAHHVDGAATGALHTSLTGPLAGSRRYTWTDVSLDDIRVVRGRRTARTVNDVALAAVSGGFRRLLQSRGEQPDAHTLRSLVPVSTREPGAESVPDNRVSLMLPYLPVDVADPVERLRVVRERIQGLRAQARAGGRWDPDVRRRAPGCSSRSPGASASACARPQRQIATVTTNVPGPRRTLYAPCREVEEMLPYVPIADRVRIGVAMFSYRDTLTFGITADYDTAPDVQVLADGIASSMDELLALARHAVLTGRQAG